MRLAAIDCGTNSIRLLITDGSKEVLRTMRIVRLGQGVDATGELDPAAIQRTREALEEYVELMKRENVVNLRMVATSATRDAKNRDEFFNMTAELLGQVVPGAQAEVISGEEEAELSFRGAVSDLTGPCLVIDLGGGSTEFVMGDEEIQGAFSAQMGCVRLTERIMRSDPPTPTEVEIARDTVREQLRLARTIVPEAPTVVGCAGTFTTIAAIALGLEHYDPHAIHMARLRTEGMKQITSMLIEQSAAVRREHPVMHPGRADVIAAGSVVVEEIIDAYGLEEMVISEKDILDGIIASI